MLEFDPISSFRSTPRKLSCSGELVNVQYDLNRSPSSSAATDNKPKEIEGKAEKEHFQEVSEMIKDRVPNRFFLIGGLYWLRMLEWVVSVIELILGNLKVQHERLGISIFRRVLLMI